MTFWRMRFMVVCICTYVNVQTSSVPGQWRLSGCNHPPVCISWDVDRAIDIAYAQYSVHMQKGVSCKLTLSVSDNLGGVHMKNPPMNEIFGNFNRADPVHGSRWTGFLQQFSHQVRSFFSALYNEHVWYVNTDAFKEWCCWEQLRRDIGPVSLKKFLAHLIIRRTAVQQSTATARQLKLAEKVVHSIPPILCGNRKQWQIGRTCTLRQHGSMICGRNRAGFESTPSMT